MVKLLQPKLNQLISGQWTSSKDHLVHIYITQEADTLQMEVTPKQSSLFNAKHDYRLRYALQDQKLTFQKKQLHWNQLNVDILLGNNLRGYKNYSCIANLTITVIGQLEIPNSEVKFILDSSFEAYCHIDQERLLRFTYSDAKFQAQTFSYAILISSTSLIQIVFSIVFLHKRPDHTQVSGITLQILILQDIYMCLFSALLFDLYSDWIYYFLPCLVLQLIAILMDLQIKICTQNYDQRSNYKAIMKSVLIGFTELLVVSFLFINIRKSRYLLLLNFYLLPLIVETYLNGKRRKFNSCFIFGVCLPRSLIALYMRGCSLNWLQLRVKYNTCAILVAIVGLQVLVYYLQCRKGLFLRASRGFNYFVRQDKVQPLSECAICLVELNKKTSVQLEVEISDQHVKGTLSDAAQNDLLMLTPCDHSFHTLCLGTWMQLKRQCPLCKKELPQIS